MSRILIVDDDRQVREELRDRIETMGHEIDEASSVAEAFKKLSLSKFDCVLLDLGIPNQFEGVASTHHGRNLLQRIVAITGGPSVIVITANGLNGYQLATEVFERGAEAFIGKPCSSERVEEKIEKVLAKRGSTNIGHKTATFSGGLLALFDDRIELCGVSVGGMKGNALIRRILPQLGRKNRKDQYIKASRSELIQAMGAEVSETAVTNAIKDFRETCKLKLGCESHDVIVTARGGGYHLNDWITFEVEAEERIDSQAERDQREMLDQLQRYGESTCRQIGDRLSIPIARVRTALSKLDDAGQVKLRGSGANASYRLAKASE